MNEQMDGKGALSANPVMNSSHKTHVTLIALIMALVASLFFFVLKEVSTLFIIAYGFALLGIAGFWAGNMYLIYNLKGYPWVAAFPATIWQYLSVEVAFSAVVVLLEQTSLYRLPVAWFVLIHAMIAAFFAVRLIVLKSGKEIIEQREAYVQEKTSILQSLRVDLSAVLDKMPESASELQAVLDAVRYSDPMSHALLLPYENEIKDSVARLEMAATEKDKEKISSLCVTLLRQIKDRNNRAKMMK